MYQITQLNDFLHMECTSMYISKNDKFLEIADNGNLNLFRTKF